MLASTFAQNKISKTSGCEPLHNQHLSTYKLSKKCTFKFLGSGKVMKNPDGNVAHRQPQSGMRVSFLLGVNVSLAAIDRYTGVPELNVDLSRKSCSMQLNGLFKQ